jgi:hypothetical protein
LLKCGRRPVEIGYSITRYASSNSGRVILNRPILDAIDLVRRFGEFTRAIAPGQGRSDCVAEMIRLSLRGDEFYGA